MIEQVRSALRNLGWTLPEAASVEPSIHPVEIERWQSADEGTYARYCRVGRERLWRVTVNWQSRTVPSTIPVEPGWPEPEPQGWLTDEQAIAALPN